MGSIYLFFAREYAQAQDVGLTAVWGLIMGTITASGIPEAVASAVLVSGAGKSTFKIYEKKFDIKITGHVVKLNFTTCPVIFLIV